MATNALSVGHEGVRAQIADSPVGSGRFDWTVAALSAWVIGGAYLDGWAHNHGKVDDVFITPWHAVLYSGVLVLFIFLAINQGRNMSKGYVWQRALPAGYTLSLLGVGLFLVGGGFDFAWHTIFGIEVNIEQLLSPSHLLLATSAALMISGPIRAAWARLLPGEARGWKILGPMIVAMMLALSLITFFTAYAHPISQPYAASGPSVPEQHPDLYAMNVDGTAQTRLTISTDTGGWGPAWSPDGQKIAFTSAPPEADPEVGGQLYLMNADGSQWVQLTHNQRANYLPSWSPDGSQIVYISQVDGQVDTSDVYLINADGSNEVQLTDTPGWDYGASWSPDGERIVFGSMRDGAWQLYTMNKDGSDQQLLDTGGGGNAPAWSPDGTRIAFTSDRYGNDEIFAINADGSNLVRLTDNDDHDDNPSWSPDGSQILFTSSRDGRDNIFAMNADGSGVRNLSQDSGRWNGAAAWSPDGTRILYAVQGDSPNASGATRALGVASILLQATVLMGIVLTVVKRWSLPFGALTFIMGLNGALMTVFHDHYQFVLTALGAGLIADVLLWQLKPSETQPKQFHVFGFATPVVFYSLYFLTLQLTQGIEWTIHLWMGAIFLAGVAGLFASFLAMAPFHTGMQGASRSSTS